MSWPDEYQSKVMSPGEALRAVASGMRVHIHPGCAEPEVLGEALIERAPFVQDVEIVHLLTLGRADYIRPEIADHLGAAKAANMVMQGALLELTGFLPTRTALAVLEASAHTKALLEVDRQSLEAGCEFIRKAASCEPPAQGTGPLPCREVFR